MTEPLAALVARLPDRLYTSREIAAFLHVHEKTIARWTRLRSDPLPCVHVRSRVRYVLRDVLAWASAQQKGADR